MTIEAIKRELNITWDDTATNEQIMVLVEVPSVAQQLFFDCLKYLRSDAYNQFLEDYSEELTALRLGGGENGTA